MRDRFMVPIEALRNASVSNADLGAWLRLHCYCAERFNGGRILACKGWGTVDWAKHAGIERRDVQRVVAAGMAAWDVEDLVLAWYDVAGEGLYTSQSAGGKAGAEKRWAKYRSAKGSPNGLPINPPKGSATGSADAQGRAGQVGGLDSLSSTDVSEDTPPARPAPRVIFSKGQTATWRDKNSDLYRSLASSFAEAGAKVVDVLRFFQVKWETRQDGPLNGEWTSVTQRHSPLEVFEIIAAAPIASIKLPSQFRAARDAFEMTERTA